MVFYDLVARLDATPELASLPDGSSFLVRGDDILTMIFLFSYSADAISFIPEVITQFSENEFRVLTEFVGGETPQEGITLGMYLSVVCSDYVPFSSLATIDAANAGVRPRLVETFGSPDIFQVCEAWNVPAADPAEYAAVVSDVPTLVLAGKFDPVTPPAWSSLAASTLSRARFLGYDDQSHGVFGSSCGGDLLNRFVRDPLADPTSACPTANRVLAFFVPETRMAAGASLRRDQLAPLVLGIPPEVLERVRHWIR
jgi:hypothetical protein